MSITAPAKRRIRYPWNSTNVTTLKAWIDAVTAAANAGTLVADSLSADETGRAAMAAGYFDEATATAKFAAGAIIGTKLKAGALAADATGRALMAAGYFTEAQATSAFAAGAITGGLLKNLAVDTAQLAAVGVTEAKIAPSILTGKHMAVGAAGNTVGIVCEEFIITCADGTAEVTEKTTLDATYGKIVVEDVYFVKGATTGGTTDAVQLCTDAGGTTPVSSVLALDGIAEGGVVRTTSLLNTAFAAGAKFYVKRVQTTNNGGTMYIRARRVV
jgi:hypothetical protein